MSIARPSSADVEGIVIIRLGSPPGARQIARNLRKLHRRHRKVLREEQTQESPRRQNRDFRNNDIRLHGVVSPPPPLRVMPLLSLMATPNVKVSPHRPVSGIQQFGQQNKLGSRLQMFGPSIKAQFHPQNRLQNGPRWQATAAPN
ncbi:hypothetical protein E4U60_006482 [Claviceps pazoutovae]|uniref:Uncharacterized protein n=1 Tax=Claviceps pazoutovae TaxID=1649127 RepID=A0A9P7MG67_9HYPO|nr:hypothetical protein E4U60_006482 [Claviceps pazoutovae]